MDTLPEGMPLGLVSNTLSAEMDISDFKQYTSAMNILYGPEIRAEDAFRNRTLMKLGELSAAYLAELKQMWTVTVSGIEDGDRVLGRHSSGNIGAERALA